jgi:hypothetical protein
MRDKATLIVPIRVYATHLTQERAIVGPEMDFESLPYFDGRRQQDVNPALPYLAESITPRPFEDANLILHAGVHLKWDLPQFLKRTTFRASDPTEFPAVPTRWLVSRYAPRGRKPDQQWIVASDALLVAEGRRHHLRSGADQRRRRHLQRPAALCLCRPQRCAGGVERAPRPPGRRLHPPGRRSTAAGH